MSAEGATKHGDIEFPVRPMRESDIGFVIHSWKTSYQSALHCAIDRDHYRVEMERTIARLWKRGARTLLATAPNNDDHLLGHATYTPHPNGDELHYIYVKQEFRRLGIARRLLRDLNIRTYTFRPPDMRRTPRGWLYTPRYTI